MKNETINFILICVAYFSIGLILAGNYIQDQTLKTTQDSVNRLILIEVITADQFDLLLEEVQSLRRNNYNRFSQKQ